MKFFLFVTFFLIGFYSYSQEHEIIELAFKDKSNFDLTTFLDNKKPTKYFVLKATNNWNTYRFHLDEDIKIDSIRKALESDEHSYYNHSYIFRDSTIDNLFNDAEKTHFYLTALSIKSKILTNDFKEFSIISSFKTAKNGFFFSISQPIFSTDKQFALIDIVTHKKDKETEDLNQSYFGTILLIYQNIKNKGWTRIKKVKYLIL
jgi:hypothetical protein